MARPDFARRSHWGGKHTAPDVYRGELDITRIPLDREGYTKGKYPRYYGTGAPLWHVENTDPQEYRDGIEIDFEIRAANKAAAKREVKRMYPDATFWNKKRKGI